MISRLPLTLDILPLMEDSFAFLAQHRFASHCCEALFLRSAPVVSEELTTPFEIITNENEGLYTSMESLFLRVVKELEKDMGYLMTDNFASHTVRVLLFVLSGRPLHDHSTKSLLQSKRKEKIQLNSEDLRTRNESISTRAVPESFQIALYDLIHNMVGNLDANYLRALATQPSGNPVLQILLELEFALFGKQKAADETSLFRKLIPEIPPEDNTVSAQFIHGMLYDPVGSHLLETIIHFCPGKLFKSIYYGQLRPKLSSIVKNETASYVLSKALERLGPEDLEDTVDRLVPDISTLFSTSRTFIIKALIESCKVRRVGTQKIAAAVRSYFGNTSETTLTRMLGFASDDTNTMSSARRAQFDATNAARPHESFLLQTMLDSLGGLQDLVLDAILVADQETVVIIAKDKHASFVLQQSLSQDSTNKNFRRKLLQKFTGRCAELAMDSIAAHIFDAFWRATPDLTFVREKIAQELAACEEAIKDLVCGRIVWKSWMMDLFIRNREVWIQRSKQSDFHSSFKSGDTVDNKPKGKRAIELAMERFAAKKASESRSHNKARTGGEYDKFRKPEARRLEDEQVTLEDSQEAKAEAAR